MTRIVVVGGRGSFGGATVDLLRRDGGRPLVGSRRPGADLVIDAEDPTSMHVLRAGDVIIDTAGSFQRRSTLLVEMCMSIGCDVIDLSDSLDYALRLQSLAPRIEAAGIRVLTSCSSVSTVSAALLMVSGVQRPVRLSAFLAPASRRASTAATAKALLSTLERPVRVRRGGVLIERPAFGETRGLAFPSPVGFTRGRLAESPDAVLLPPVWPTLRDVDFWIDTRRGALNALFAAAARHSAVRRVVWKLEPVGRRLTGWFGASSGGFAVEVEDATGRRAASGFLHPHRSYIVAIAPAILAAKAIAAGRFRATGLIPPHRHVDAHELVAWLRAAGVQTFGPSPPW